MRTAAQRREREEKAMSATLCPQLTAKGTSSALEASMASADPKQTLESPRGHSSVNSQLVRRNVSGGSRSGACSWTPKGRGQFRPRRRLCSHSDGLFTVGAAVTRGHTRKPRRETSNRSAAP